VKAPTGAELNALAGRIGSRVGRFLERQGLLERDAQSACLSELALDHEPMQALAFALDHLPHRGGAARRAQRVHARRTCPPAMRHSLRGQASSAASVCTPAWRRGPMSAASSSGCAAPSAARRCRRRACRSLPAAWCATNRPGLRPRGRSAETLPRFSPLAALDSRGLGRDRLRSRGDTLRMATTASRVCRERGVGWTPFRRPRRPFRRPRRDPRPTDLRRRFSSPWTDRDTQTPRGRPQGTSRRFIRSIYTPSRPTRN